MGDAGTISCGSDIDKNDSAGVEADAGHWTGGNDMRGPRGPGALYRAGAGESLVTVRDGKTSCLYCFHLSYVWLQEV